MRRRWLIAQIALALRIGALADLWADRCAARLKNLSRTNRKGAAR